jgi:hypothetical protein
MKTFTVKEVAEIFNNAVARGLGDCIVLVPNQDEEVAGEYATLGEIDMNATEKNPFVYLEGNGGDEENKFWEERMS